MKKDIILLVFFAFGLCGVCFFIGKLTGIEQTKTDYKTNQLKIINHGKSIF